MGLKRGMTHPPPLTTLITMNSVTVRITRCTREGLARQSAKCTLEYSKIIYTVIRNAYRYGTLLLSLMRLSPPGSRAATIDGQQLGMRVNRIYTWLPGKSGKIDKRAGRAASPAARLAPPPRVGGWESLVIRRLHNRECVLSPRKQTTQRHAA
jgi:hypothetical protein